ncbi:uncharacterized protein [Henckelia pumila]|uniref:uncharacterized protein n=1 Tax=Henckelia pumila TaxID=405737 RepID=UPI003C6E7232
MAEPSDKSATTPAAVKVEDHESAAVEVGDRGLFDFLGKKKEEKQEEVLASEFQEKVEVCEEKKEEETKLHRSSSSSSSSSSDEEEAVEGGEKKKKKKGLKEKIELEQKKGFLDKIKEKLPGGKKTEEAAPPKPEVVECATVEGKEKKGFLDKIKEKIPGYNAKGKEEACN